jgi:hypothetical protein
VDGAGLELADELGRHRVLQGVHGRLERQHPGKPVQEVVRSSRHRRQTGGVLMGDAALIKKLGIKPGQRAAIINPPDGYADRIGPPQGVETTTDLNGTFDFVQVFAKDRATLDRHLTSAHAVLKPGGLFWISYPKGSSKVPTDLNRDVFWDALEHLGVRPVTQVSVDEVWSALRFRPFAEVGSR